MSKFFIISKPHISQKKHGWYVTKRPKNFRR